jgi:hypothetical protein
MAEEELTWMGRMSRMKKELISDYRFEISNLKYEIRDFKFQISYPEHPAHPC